MIRRLTSGMTIKRAVGGAIGLYVAGFLAVVGVGLTVGNQPATVPAVPDTASIGGQPAVRRLSDPSPAVGQPGTVAPAPTNPSPTAAAPSAVPSPAPSPVPSSNPSPLPSPTPPVPTPTPQPTPPPATPQCGSGGKCTAAQVAAHNSSSDCWAIYAARVYNLTSYVPKHPYAVNVFNSTTCGTDIEPFMNGSQPGVSGGRKHNHSGESYAILLSYYLADLQ